MDKTNENGSHLSESNSEMEDVNLNMKDSQYFSDMPAQIENRLEFLTINANGHLLMGSSNLTGRYWCGSIWYYTDSSLAPDIDGCKAGMEFNGGVIDAEFVNENRAIIGEDGGVISFITIKHPEENPQIVRTHQIDDHGHSVISVKIMCNKKSAITASMDMSILLWDCELAICNRNFTPAHTQEITGISPHPKHPELFLSSSIDGNVLLWDLRCSKPASCVFRDLDDCPTAVSWVCSKENEGSNFVVGTVSGKLHLREKSNYSYSITHIKPFKRPIFRIMPNVIKSNLLAMCANETEVIVCTVEKDQIKINYRDDRHNDFVRGLAWQDEHKLLSCGWDKNVFEHTI